jgi:hypothetical protein
MKCSWILSSKGSVSRGALLLLVVWNAYGQQFFPPGILGKGIRPNEFIDRWYSKHLSALREPSLWETSQSDLTAEAYRFLYLRSFHHPISVRLVVAQDKTATLVSKETNGKGGYEPGRLIRNRTIHMSQTQTEAFLTALNELSFWSLPPLLETEGNFIQTDGAQWILEGVKQGRYHLVDRLSPDRTNDPIRIIGTRLMIDRAHFRLLYLNVY